jgi:hypothetical protein
MRAQSQIFFTRAPLKLGQERATASSSSMTITRVSSKAMNSLLFAGVIRARRLQHSIASCGRSVHQERATEASSTRSVAAGLR